MSGARIYDPRRAARDRVYREASARALAVQLGLDPDSLIAGTEAAWSNLNPDRTSYAAALSVAAAVLLGAPASLTEHELRALADGWIASGDASYMDAVFGALDERRTARAVVAS